MTMCYNQDTFVIFEHLSAVFIFGILNIFDPKCCYFILNLGYVKHWNMKAMSLAYSEKNV